MIERDGKAVTEGGMVRIMGAEVVIVRIAWSLQNVLTEEYSYPLMVTYMGSKKLCVQVLSSHMVKQGEKM